MSMMNEPHGERASLKPISPRTTDLGLVDSWFEREANGVRRVSPSGSGRPKAPRREGLLGDAIADAWFR